MMIAAVALLLALDMGRHPISLAVAADRVALLACVVLTALFAWWLRRAPEPFLPLPCSPIPVMRTGTMASGLAMGVVDSGSPSIVPLYFEVVHGLSAAASGLALIPLVVMSTPGSIMSSAGRSAMPSTTSACRSGGKTLLAAFFIFLV